jgi:predicted ATPase
MAVRPPELFSTKLKDPLAAALDYELAADMAHSLGQAGKRVERELTALTLMGVDDPKRLEALKSCAKAVHAYFIQREICGMRRHDAIIREMGIPQSVLVRLGAS